MSDVEIVVEDGAGEQPEQLLEILSGDDLALAVEYLKKEYEAASSEMDARNQKIIKWRRNMEAIANDAPRNHPFKNSSNVTVPVTQTVTQALFAKLKGTFDARDPLWSVEPLRRTDEDVKKYKVIEKYLNMLAKSPHDLNMEQVTNDLVMETVLVGGSFPKVIYSVEEWRVKDGNGGENPVIWHDGPSVLVAPLERVKYRRGVGKISRLPWIAVDTPLTEHELRERASRGVYDPKAVELILGNMRTTPTDMEEQLQIAETFDSGENTGLFDVSEVWFYWDVDGTGVPVDCFFTIHFETGAVLKQQYNTLGTRFIVPARYVHRPNALVGRGVGQMTESMQDEVTTVHNMRNDNMKVANMRLLAVKRGSGLGSKRELFPGALWEFDNPETDIRPIQLGEVYPSSLQAEMNSMSYAQKSAGLSDTQMGFADQTLKSRDTARGQAMRAEAGDSILGSIAQGLRDTMSQIAMLVWMQCIANKERVVAREQVAQRLTEEELQILTEALNTPITEVPMKMQFMVKTTDADKTYAQQRQNVMTLTQVYSQFAQQTVPLAMQLYSPQGIQLQQAAPEAWNYMARIMTGAGKLMEQVFQFFGVYNVNDFVPDPDKVDQMLDMMTGMAQSFGGAPGAPGAQGPVQQGPGPGMGPAGPTEGMEQGGMM
jgi:hypothetical protein